MFWWYNKELLLLSVVVVLETWTKKNNVTVYFQVQKWTNHSPSWMYCWTDSWRRIAVVASRQKWFFSDVQLSQKLCPVVARSCCIHQPRLQIKLQGNCKLFFFSVFYCLFLIMNPLKNKNKWFGVFFVIWLSIVCCNGSWHGVRSHSSRHRSWRGNHVLLRRGFLRRQQLLLRVRNVRETRHRAVRQKQNRQHAREQQRRTLPPPGNPSKAQSCKEGKEGPRTATGTSLIDP